MSDCIKREDAIKSVLGITMYKGSVPLDTVIYLLKNIPSAEKQGEWIETSEGTMCGNCHKFPYDDGEYHIANWHSKFCPNCGARMKGADNEY